MRSNSLIAGVLVWAACAAGLHAGPQAGSRAEFRAFIDVLDAETPLEIIRRGEDFLALYPATEFREKVLELEFQAFQKRGDFAAARRVGAAILRLDARNAAVLAEMAVLAAETGARSELPTARDYAERAVNSASHATQPAGAARPEFFRWKRELIDSARAALDLVSLYEALSDDPAVAEAHHNLGLVWYRLKRYDRAAQSFRRAIELKPGLAGSHLFLGLSEFRLARFEEASREFRFFLKQEPANREAQLFLIRSESALDRFSIEEVSRALMQFPKDEELHFAAGLAGLSRVRVITHQVDQLGKQSPEFLWLRQRKSPEKYSAPPPPAPPLIAEYDAVASIVRQSFEFVLENTTGSRYARNARGYLLEAQNKVYEAVAEYRAAGDHFAAGRLLAQNTLLDEAVGEYRLAIQDDPENHRAVADLASLYVQMEEPEKARPLLESLVKRYPGDADAWADLAKVQERLGAIEQAAQSLAAALRADPSRDKLHYRLGQLYRKLGKTDLADAELREFQRLQKPEPPAK